MKIPGIPSKQLTKIFSIKGDFFHSVEPFTLKAVKNNEIDVNRFALVAGKKHVSKSAVHRKRASRRMKSALQLIYPNLKQKGYDFVVFIQSSMVTIPWKDLKSQVQYTFKKMEKKQQKGKKKTP